jgi:hypothetical protein
MIPSNLSPSPLIRRRRTVAVSDRLAFFYTLNFDFSKNHQTVICIYFVHIIVVLLLYKLIICFSFKTFFSILS